MRHQNICVVRWTDFTKDFRSLHNGVEKNVLIHNLQAVRFFVPQPISVSVLFCLKLVLFCLKIKA